MQSFLLLTPVSATEFSRCTSLGSSTFKALDVDPGAEVGRTIGTSFVCTKRSPHWRTQYVFSSWEEALYVSPDTHAPVQDVQLKISRCRGGTDVTPPDNRRITRALLFIFSDYGVKPKDQTSTDWTFYTLPLDGISLLKAAITPPAAFCLLSMAGVGSDPVAGCLQQF